MFKIIIFLGSRKWKTVANEITSGIIYTGIAKEVADVHIVGKINWEIYKCITDDIVTDEVIITDERIQHIIDRRGKEFYEKYGEWFKIDPNCISVDSSFFILDHHFNFENSINCKVTDVIYYEKGG